MYHNRVVRYRSKTNGIIFERSEKVKKHRQHYRHKKAFYICLWTQTSYNTKLPIPNANILCKQFTKYIIFHEFIPPFTSSSRFCWLRHGWWTYSELGTPNCPATYRQTLAIYRAVALQRKWRHSSNYMFRANPQKCRLFMTASALMG